MILLLATCQAEERQKECASGSGIYFWKQIQQGKQRPWKVDGRCFVFMLYIDQFFVLNILWVI